ncbi:MAG: hypothetical protein AB9888_13095 [Bacteroidales bacterium]
MEETKKELKLKFAWALLHETTSQKIRSSLPTGRPPRSSPTRKSTVHLTTGDEEAIRQWQAYFSSALDKKVSLGETFGLMARILRERAELLNIPLHEPDTQTQKFLELVQKLVGIDDSD